MKSGQLTSWIPTTSYYIIVVGREVLGRSLFDVVCLSRDSSAILMADAQGASGQDNAAQRDALSSKIIPLDAVSIRLPCKNCSLSRYPS